MVGKRKNDRKKKAVVELNDTYIERQWKNYSQPGALTALTGFVKSKNIKDIQAAEKSLSKIQAYSLHRPHRKKFKRRVMIVRGPRHTFCADLADFQSMKGSNSGYAWILVCIDTFSKELFTAPLKKKDNDNVLAGFKLILQQAKKAPAFLQSDQGLEFVGKRMKAFYKKNNIHHYVTYSKLKAFMCERMIRSLKERLYRYMTLNHTKRWLDALEPATKSYNNTVHSSHGFKPVEINRKNQDQAFVNMYHSVIKNGTPSKPPKFKEGDLVRISKNRVTFEKGYTASYSEEVFIIKQVKYEVPVYVYVLQDKEGEQVQSTFYEEDLSLAG